MNVATGFEIGAAGLMAAGFLLYNVRRDRGADGSGWTGWCCGQLVLLLLLVRVEAPQPALVAPGLGVICALPMAARGLARDWRGLTLPGAIFLWFLLLLGPVGELDVTAEIRLVFALLSGLVVAAAGWPLLAGVCADPARGRPLAWFLWSTAYGLAALALMAAQVDWPLLVFPLLAQGFHLVAGMVTVGSGESAAAGSIGGVETTKAAF